MTSPLLTLSLFHLKKENQPHEDSDSVNNPHIISAYFVNNPNISPPKHGIVGTKGGRIHPKIYPIAQQDDTNVILKKALASPKKGKGHPFVFIDGINKFLL